MHTTRQDIKNLGRLKKRSDFLRVQSSGRKWVCKSFILQRAPSFIPENKHSDQKSETGNSERFGVTVTKKLEKSAVRRNRMKRRLRAIAYDVLAQNPPHEGAPRYDYVLIARRETAERCYADMVKDLKWCLRKLDSTDADGTPLANPATTDKKSSA